MIRRKRINFGLESKYEANLRASAVLDELKVNVSWIKEKL